MKLLVFVLACLFFSCGSEKPAHFTVSGTEAGLFAKTRAAQEGLLDFSGSKKLEYRFYESFTIPSNSSFVIEYSFSVLPSQPVQDNFSLVLNMGDSSWELPMDSNGIQYLIPVDNSFSGSFNVSLEAKNKPVIKIPKKDAPVLEISFIGFTERKFGFNTSSEKVMLTPFVNIIDNAQSSETVYVIDVPESLREKKFAEINAVFTGGQASPEATPAAALEISGRKIESFPGAGRIYIPPALYSGNKAVFSWKPASGSKIESFELKFEDPPVFPNPIKADPVFIITWQRANWRNTEYELFRWDRFPSILFFDYADYAAQDRMLKRLAFYVEKAGFRGRLAADSEIAHLHGWNAHNYRAEDLARFFQAARDADFPLHSEEHELERILL
ncbi:MAG: hypothetical protein LBU66_05620, partial [Treponema sp.]|nr:hypothetical protein [Treponema sp.]